MRSKTLVSLAFVALPLVPVPALAADWVATNVEGVVMALQDGHWSRLKPSETVSDGQQVRTLRSGRALFTRNGETIAVAGDTQMSIAQERGGSYTVVHQWFGRTDIADKEQPRPHFEVDTPYMAAVVKGTVFSVSTGRGYSQVAVSKGRVQVQDLGSRLHVDVLPGQQASGGQNAPLQVKGSGDLQPIKNAAGKVVNAVPANADSEAAPSPIPAKPPQKSGPTIATKPGKGPGDKLGGPSHDGHGHDGPDRPGASAGAHGGPDGGLGGPSASRDNGPGGSSDHGPGGGDHGPGGGDHGPGGGDHGPGGDHGNGGNAGNGGDHGGGGNGGGGKGGGGHGPH